MKVSVIIPVYNAATFLERAVNSALQHPEVKELLLIEDGSNDNSLAICKELAAKHKFIKVLQHPKGENRGAGASRNLGITNASEDYIAFLDADDYYTEIRFQKEKEIFSEQPEADGVYGAIGVEYLDKTGAEAWEAKGFDEESLTTVNKPIDPNHLFEYLIGLNNPEGYKGYFSIDGLTLRRESLLDAKVLFDSSLRLHQDTVFMWQLSYCLKLFTGEFQKPIANRGVHSQNRFIHEKELHKSRSKQYKALRDWSIEEKLDKKIITRFHQKYFTHFIASKKKIQVPFSYLILLSSDSYTRNSFGKKQLKFIWLFTFH